MSRNFTDVIGDLQGGRVHQELTDQLNDLIKEVMEHRKAGSISLTIDVKPNAANQVEVKDKITVKLPQADRMKTMFFTNEEGDLLRRDPRQPDLPLKSVSDVTKTEEVG